MREATGTIPVGARGPVVAARVRAVEGGRNRWWASDE